MPIRVGSIPNCDVQPRDGRCPLDVDPRHPIARDKRPRRVRPKSARVIPSRRLRLRHRSGKLSLLAGQVHRYVTHVTRSIAIFSVGSGRAYRLLPARRRATGYYSEREEPGRDLKAGMSSRSRAASHFAACLP
jgi:hypothetical protein